MKVFNHKGMQLLALLAVLALNEAFTDRSNQSYEMTLASTASIGLQDSRCKSINNIKRDKDAEHEINVEFGDRSIEMDLVSLEWDLMVYSYDCVKQDGTKETKYYLKVKERDVYFTDRDTEACSGCLEEAIDIDTLFQGGSTTKRGIVTDIAEILIDAKIKELKKYIANYKENRNKVRDCTHSWKQGGQGLVKEINSSEEIYECRIARLEDGFTNSRERYRYFKKYFYHNLVDDIASGNESVLEEARGQLDELEYIADHTSTSAMRRDIDQLNLLHRYTTTAFESYERYDERNKDCQIIGLLPEGNNFPEGNSFYMDTLNQRMQLCQSREKLQYERELDILKNNFNRQTVHFPESHHLQDRLGGLLSEFKSGMLAERTGIVVEAFRQKDDIILGTNGLIPSFIDSNISPPLNLNTEVNVIGVRFR